MRLIPIVTACLTLSAMTGCSTTTKLASDGVDGIPDNIGIVVVTTGSEKNTPYINVKGFVSYRVFHFNADGDAVSDDFLPAEKVLLSRPNGVIGKGKYGFMHIFEVPPGRYYLAGIKGRGYDLTVPVGGIFVPIEGRNLGGTDILMSFEVVGGRLNYLGELLFTGGDLANESIAISNRWERDRETAIKANKGIADYEAVFTSVEKLNATDLAPPSLHDRGE